MRFINEFFNGFGTWPKPPWPPWLFGNKNWPVTGDCRIDRNSTEMLQKGRAGPWTPQSVFAGYGADTGPCVFMGYKNDSHKWDSLYDWHLCIRIGSWILVRAWMKREGLVSIVYNSSYCIVFTRLARRQNCAGTECESYYWILRNRVH